MKRIASLIPGILGLVIPISKIPSLIPNGTIPYSETDDSVIKDIASFVISLGSFTV